MLGEPKINILEYAEATQETISVVRLRRTKCNISGVLLYVPEVFMTYKPYD